MQALAALDLPLQKVAQAAGQIGWQAENLQRNLFAAGLCNNVFGKELLSRIRVGAACTFGDRRLCRTSP